MELMTDAFRNLVNNHALTGNIQVLREIGDALEAMGTAPEELLYVVNAQLTAVQVLTGRLELSLGQKATS